MRARLELVPKREASFIEPMECALVSRLPEGPDWSYEVKLDGYRSIGVKTTREAISYSRNGKNFNKRYPYLAEALADLPPDTVIDGEIVALDDSGRPDFRRLHTSEPSPRAFTTLSSIFLS
jgi:bifunctional non-homologous end joining protein LigD